MKENKISKSKSPDRKNPKTISQIKLKQKIQTIEDVTTGKKNLLEIQKQRINIEDWVHSLNNGVSQW